MQTKNFIRTKGRKSNKTDLLLIFLIILTAIGVVSDLIVLKEGWRTLFGWIIP